MMYVDHAALRAFAVHFVGNPSREISSHFSQRPPEIDDNIRTKVRNALLSNFKQTDEIYQFTHPNDLQYNELYNFAGESLTNHRDFHEISIDIARHLQTHSKHPMIKPGECYVCLFEDIQWKNQSVNALGIFKTESKSGFFNMEKGSGTFDIQYLEGIDLRRVERLV